MLDRKSDYALNKQDPDAIVCKSVTGVHIRLTRADFSSEEEFRKWKAWSDQDYHATEQGGRGYGGPPLEDWTLPSVLSPEDLMLEADVEAQRDAARAALAEQIRSQLTETQYRRLSLYYLEGMTEREIAKLEGVGQQRVSRSILAGKRALKKIFEKILVDRG